MDRALTHIFVDSESGSDTTAILFNLDRLNETRPEVMQCHGWEKGCIPESPDSYIENLVQRVDRGRFRFELGGSSNGPRLMTTQIRNSGQGVTQEGPQGGNLGSDVPIELGPNLRDLGPFEQLTLGPGPLTSHTTPTPTVQTPSLWCNESRPMLDGMETSKPCSRKRIRKEIGKFGRNIKQRILCAVFDKEMTHEEGDSDRMVSFEAKSSSSSRLREAGLQQLPQQP